MKIEPVSYNDLDDIRTLQPDKWPDIVPDFEFYVKSDFCNPIKVESENKIIGVGTSVLFDNTSWIAHIIVDGGHRKRGFGSIIVKELMDTIDKFGIETCSLIATDIGKPIYQKAGFREVTEYKFLIRDTAWVLGLDLVNVLPYNDRYSKAIFDMDKRITGENRERLIGLFLNNAIVYIKNGILQGYFLPDLKEGPICAEIDEAGLELMKYKYSKVDKAALPSDNIVGLNFLRENGFVDASAKGTRMIYGKDINWKPKNIYSRIGGNFG